MFGLSIKRKVLKCSINSLYCYILIEYMEYLSSDSLQNVITLTTKNEVISLIEIK